MINYRKLLSIIYPEFQSTINKKCDIFEKYYNNYIKENHFAAQLMVDEYNSSLVKNPVKFESDYLKYKSSDFGNGNHVAKYLEDEVGKLMMDLDRRQNLKDFDDNEA